MKFLLRFMANTVALYLTLYLVDSVTRGRFTVGAVSAAVLLALFLSLANSPIRPLHRVGTKTQRALFTAFLTVIMNVIIVQVFCWIGPVHADNLSWVLLVAAFVTLIAGTMNWLVGFSPPPKNRRISRTRTR
jgi:uncharacterized membrane protein YvlD (DUF360 family)